MTPELPESLAEVLRAFRASYIIASTPRSGSEMLCRMLAAAGLGEPREYFTPLALQPFDDPSAPDRARRAFELFMERAAAEAAGPGGTAGFKIQREHWTRLMSLLRRLYPERFRSAGDLDVARAVFKNPRYVRLFRRDKVRQSVSWSVACQTGEWHRAAGSASGRKRPPKFLPSLIALGVPRFVEEENFWSAMLDPSEVDLLSVDYESLAGDTASVFGRISAFVGTGPLPPPASAVQPTSDGVTESFVARFNRIPAAFRPFLRSYARVVHERLVPAALVLLRGKS